MQVVRVDHLLGHDREAALRTALRTRAEKLVVTQPPDGLHQATELVGSDAQVKVIQALSADAGFLEQYLFVEREAARGRHQDMGEVHGD